MELNFILHVGFSKEIMWVRLWSWSDMMNYGGGKEVLLLPAWEEGEKEVIFVEEKWMVMDGL
jgi:hypothetical protein